jgi:hypothetical protein
MSLNDLWVDGFESSASKLALKEKYGHTKIVTTVAPPPIFGAAAPPGPTAAPPPMMGSGPPPVAYQQTTQPAYLQNRYVAYDLNAPPAPYGQPQPSVPSAYPSMVPPAISTDTSTYPPSVYSPGIPPHQSFTPSPSQVQTVDATVPPHPTTTTRLNPSPRIHVNPVDNVFNPVTDRVVSATSSSSALM